jgi:cell division protein FtsI/penicillin-binding protein 2
MAKIWTTRNRALVVGIGLAMAFTACSFRLVFLIEKDRIPGQKPRMSGVVERNLTLYAKRGVIWDKHNEVLASEDEVSRVIADSSLIPPDKVEAIADLLVQYIRMPRQEALDVLNSHRRYIILSRKTPKEDALNLKRACHDQKLPGIYLEDDWQRDYPNGQLLSQVVGHTNAEHVGVAGLEQSADSLLRGTNGYRKYTTDASGRELSAFRREEVPPVNGANLRLALDSGAQAIVDKELDHLVAKYKPEKATILIMNPHTGDLIAMGNRPTFDPRDLKSSEMSERRNPAVQDVYEPGSTFKIVAAAAALNEGIVGPETSIFCHNGSFMYKGSELKDHHAYGDLTVTNILAKSSNVGAAKLALQLGQQRYFQYVQAFGFGEKTGVKLPAETRGILTPLKHWQPITITRVPMGHSIAVTPMQMVCAMSVIANGGVLLEPRVVEAKIDENGKTLEPMPVVSRRRVLKVETARQLRRMLVKTTQKGGTATQAAIPGYEVAGKTGTAQKVREGRPGYIPGKYVVSFLGFLPADDPAFVGIVVVDAPKASEDEAYGGTIAAPSFARVATELVKYLDLEPDPKLLSAAAE